MNIDDLSHKLVQRIGRILDSPSPSVKSPFSSGGDPSASTDPPTPSATNPQTVAAFISLTKAFEAIALPGWWGEATAGNETETAPTSRQQDGADVELATRSGPGGQLITLHLTPPAIGPLTVVLSFSETSVQAQIAAQDEGSVRAMAELAPQLRRSLAELWDVKDIRIVQRPEGST